jgi:pyruvate dehydrogenase E1 component alpha subunit
MEIPKEKLLEMYRKLVTCRKVDDKLYELNTTGIFSGWLHLGAGQEAMPVAVGSILRKDDYLKPGRGEHCAVAKGVPLKSIFASMMAKKQQTEKPESGVYAPEYGLLGISGSLGEDVPIYVGAALSSKQLGIDLVTVCFFGEGTANRGPVHEAMNLAAIWKLPIVFICENNQYAISMHVSRAFAIADIADRAAGYGMPGVVVDGNDVIACYEVAYDAIKRAREGGGPSFIEDKTYRLRGHWEGDPERYRPKEEIEEWRKKEPLKRYRERLLKLGILTAEDVERYDAEITAEIEEAVKYAESLPRPSLEELTETLRL